MRVKHWYLELVLIMLPYLIVNADDMLTRSVLNSIHALKQQNFYIQTIGILVAGELTQVDVDALQELQTAQPRYMRIFVTQNELLQDVYRDFTFLARSKKVDAVLVWPSEIWQDATFKSKVCQMSMRTKVPVIGLQPGWVQKGALLEFGFENTKPTLIYNQKSCQVYNYSCNPIPGYEIIGDE